MNLKVLGVFVANDMYIGHFCLKESVVTRNMQLMMYALFLLPQTVMSKRNCLKWVECCVLEKSGSIYLVAAVWNSSPGTEELELHQRVDETPML